MQVTMQHAERLTLAEMREFLDASSNLSFAGTGRKQIYGLLEALLHDSTAARVGALFQLLVQDTTAQDFGLPSSAIRLRM